MKGLIPFSVVLVLGGFLFGGNHPSEAFSSSSFLRIKSSSSLSKATTTRKYSVEIKDQEPQQQSTTNSESAATRKQPPNFWSALFGIGINGSPWEYMIRLVEEGYTDVVPINLGPVGVYNFLLSPQVVRAATVEEASTLSRRFSVSLFETLELDKGLVYEQGTRHKKHKRLCIPSFEQTQSMESFVKATRTELNSLSSRFSNTIIRSDSETTTTSPNNNRIDLYAEMRRSTLNVVLDVTFGLGSEGANSFEKADELSAIIGEYLERIVALANEIPPLWQIAPRLSNNYNRVTDYLLPNLRKLVSEVISRRRIEEEKKNRGTNTTTTTTTNVEKADLLGVLVADGTLDDKDIRSILFDVVIAGSDTTASTTTAALYVLHEPQNKKWLENCRKEAIQTNAGDGIELSNLRNELPIATAIAREILRLYPPVPFVGRTATEKGSLLNGKFPIEIGDTFCFSPWFLGRDPRAWGSGDGGGTSSTTTSEDKEHVRKRKRAEEFDPQRWLDDPINGGAPSTFSWLPFGAGARGCLGTRLGLTEVTLGISRLLKDFEFDFETKGPLPVKYDLTLNLDNVMNCQIENRK